VGIGESVLREGISLKGLTTFRIGGPARFLAEPAYVDELQGLCALAREEGWPLLLLGGGSNLLVGDKGFPGLVVLTRALRRVKIEGDRIWAQSGASLTALAILAQEAGLSGLEALGGIPGTLGGGLIMNAGAFGRFLGELVEEVEVLIDGKVEVLTGDELDWGYRKSGLEGKILVGATLRLVHGDREGIGREMALLNRKKRESQPLDEPSAGSVFKNPPGKGAGRLIEMAGLKGFRVGDAMVSRLHANFIVNMGKAKAKDVVNLIGVIKGAVEGTFSVSLEEEIIYAGAFEEDEDCFTPGGAFI